ncbi:MAG: hypothetical protein CL961_05240 [Euryarchaeota archaeon]|nr:hypothetical protein [Euryarchaeota archaeon]
MRVSTIDGINALASILIDDQLLGNGAIEFGSPDLIIMNSGGPATHLASNSILCGPSKTRIVIKQPSSLETEQKYDALSGEIVIDYDKLNFTAEVEEWKHGCWYHANIISANSINDLFSKLTKVTPNVDFILNNDELLPDGPFWSGAISYDLVQWTQPLNLTNLPNEGDVLAVLWLVEDYVFHSNLSNEFQVFGTNSKWVDLVLKAINSKEIIYQIAEQLPNDSIEKSTLSDLEHIACIEKIKQSIAEGVLYQVNFGRFWSGKLVEAPLAIFQRLCLINPAPFSIFIEAQDLGLAIVSSSPETMLRANSGKISTAPIKGTVTRGADQLEDREMIESMISDIKERSEHRMLVDLMRNELSSVCDIGTVNLSRFDVESYANVHHLVSHIDGRLCQNKTSADAFDSLFPGGSITGCPKTMVCAVIDQIEPQNRSFWTGSAGWIQPHSGDCSWNILIRTLEAHRSGKQWHGKVGAGGGITIRSKPESEVEEAVWKSQAIRKVCGWLPPDFDKTNVGKLERTSLEIENLFEYKKSGSIFSITNNPAELKSLKGRVLIIDNLDSFTLNIAHAIAGLGRDICIINGRDAGANQLSNDGQLLKILTQYKPSHIIIGPGPGKPQDSKLTMAMANLSLNEQLKIPILGICLGHQALGLADGYQLIKDPNGAVHGTPVNCQNDNSGLFVNLSNSGTYVRYNSLLITPSKENTLLPNIFDESGAIMGLRHKSKNIHSVQFHPESIGSSNGLQIFSSFLELQSDA